MKSRKLLEMSGIGKSYSSDVLALTDVSFTIAEGECVGLVGESGSGKSTLAKLILGLEKPDRGSIMLSGVPFHSLTGRALRLARQHVQVVFQDPAASLNPRLPIWKTVIEPLENYPEAVPEFPRNDRNSKRGTASLLLDRVGLGTGLLDYYPHQLSGGQKQRVAIARGLSLQPKLLICDEPTSSLDVSIQAQILNLLKELQKEFNMSYLFISHDIASVRYMSDRIAVLKEGRLADLFESEELFSPERHEYTRRMVQAVTL
ncbi:dipeptide/oligopeptide/nickel ABC transporter ATP-binding protein [Paenibacillus sp. sptzw28]|uniref:ABC transporter ATP-binding protein n=1 Tax=Paenibacillus sp. sptzw28 TaxID=715179 RepID=UPI001C6E46E6|nr:dipeptide/oligopeptide/nickel ABC transporter ATP-binding protein [Paenibacillus sp. sptzw28]QYR19574.1 dipeptide/oligopeptide/nickel ABC transporter ATP-binding protein [Paenibacillus sp. sptzw28]